MDAHPRSTDVALVGRASELAAIGTLIDRVAGGEAGAMLISGDAGVGKTALVERACAQADSPVVVLAGACLPLSAMTVPFLALRSAVRSASPVLDPPAGLMGTRDVPSSVPLAFDAWLEDLCRDRPVILAIDDLHWADQSTLDVLMYLLAGPADRRLAVVATLRSGETGDGHPLQHWLANVRRLPRIEQVVLDPLDRVATSDHLAALMSTSPHQSLVDDVFARTRGNAYLNRLLVKDLASDARSLPCDHPADLSSAVLQSWQTLPSETRELTRILATGGGPLTASTVARVSGAGIDPDDVHSSLLLAVEAGILEVARNGSLWFHHPMIAEILEQDLSDDERVRWHSAFAERAEKQMTDESPPPTELMVAAADHHDRAGHVPEAYRWALRAADSAGSSGGTAEELRLLQRAMDLRATGFPGTQESERDLLQRMVAAAAATGAFREELRAVDLLLAGIDSELEPLLAAELLVRRADLRFLTGLDFLSERDVRTAVDLSAAGDPASWQHAYALASLVRIAMWQDDPEMETLADRALVVARGTDSSLALSCALSAKASVLVGSGRCRESLQLAEEAVAAAVQAQDFQAFVSGAVWETNSLQPWSPRILATHLCRRRVQMTALGAPHAYSAAMSAFEADAWLTIGEWRACQDRLRDALGSDPGPFADVQARLAAAQLAAWQGRSAEAQAHLTRADELFAEGSEFLPFSFDVSRAVVALAAGDPEAALTAALAGTVSPGVPPDRCEWLVPLAARALADLIEDDRAAGRDPDDHGVRLDDLVTRFPSVIRDSGQPAEPEDPHVLAMTDLYEAEVGRARRLSGNGDQWLRAADSCSAGSLAWEETYSCWRAAESLLAHGRQRREQAASVLRRGLTLAGELGAEPIRRELEALASSARIRIERVTEVPASELAGLPDLTTREREILAHVVAGRTYREIARALVISEKTVSSHISNLLRKTGADNRVDLSRLATRSSPGSGPEH